MARRAASTKQTEKEAAYAKIANEIVECDFDTFVQTNFLPYAWSACLDRALVDVTDGLKPVQRRILASAARIGLTNKGERQKSLTFVGEVAKLHPHGDASAYTAMANIAEPETEGQPRNMRLPLVLGKGNWGTLDKDPAAPRYTELRLTPAGMEVISELKEDTVDFAWNYNNSVKEPVRLPARFPVAFINGVPKAMAVAFACNSPCHNPNEVMDACIALLRDPKMKDADLLKIVKGPDFNCGCDIIATTTDKATGKPIDGVKEYLTTGRGTFTMKSKYTVKEENGCTVFNFTNLPYTVSPKQVISEIASKYEKGTHFKELSSWKDLSDFNNPVNLEVRLKRGVNTAKVLEDLFKNTSLRCTFPVNATIVGIDNIPKPMGVREILEEFIEFRRVCTRRKLEYRVTKKKELYNRQQGIIAVRADIDKCIKIIRESKDSEVAKTKLMKTFKIDEEQAEYVLALQLKRLTKNDSLELKREIDNLKKEIAELEKTLASDKRMTSFIISEMEDTKAVIASPRKCKIFKSDKEDASVQAIQDGGDIYLTIDQSGKKFKRSFKKSDGAFKVADDGRVGILVKNTIYPVSIYEAPDGSQTSISSISPARGASAVLPGEGYLLVVGSEGRMKTVDLSSVSYPTRRNSTVDGILSEDIIFSRVLKERKGTVSIEFDGKKKDVSVEDIPLQSIKANGKMFTNRKKVDSVKLK